MAIIMPLFATVVVLYGLIKRVPVFDLFIKGVREGVKVLYTIAPTIIGLVFAVDLLRCHCTKKDHLKVTPLYRPQKVRPKKSNFGGRYFYVKIQL